MTENCMEANGRRGLVSNLFWKPEESSPSSKRLLEAEGSSEDDLSPMFSAGRSSYGLNAGSGPFAGGFTSQGTTSPGQLRMRRSSNGKREANFTIGAVHSTSSRALMRRGSRQGSFSIRASPGRVNSKVYQRSSATESPPLTAKTTPPEIAALDRELQRMFKLQLGPLTIGRDIQPVLDMWSKLVAIRATHGRKAVADTWAQLAQATAIVSRKMSMEDIMTTVDVQIRLVQPCPRGLRLPTAMFVALADRAGTGGELRAATETELLNFCSLVGRLMVIVGGLEGSASPGTVQQCTKALDRVSAVVPLAQAAMTEIVRRCKGAARRCAKRDASSNSRSAITSTLLVAEALAELAGLPLAEPDVCLRRASLAAAAEAEEAHKNPKEMGSWWQKFSVGACLKSSQDIQALKELPMHASVCTVEVQRLAGEAAECMARCLAPSSVPSMSPSQLSRLAKALRDGTVEDDGHSSHEPLRQTLGLVLAEVARRAEARDSSLTRSCVKTTISTSRSRLLHIYFRLAAPEGGVAAALAQLEAWKWWESRQAQRSSPAQATRQKLADKEEEKTAQQDLQQQSPVYEKEATSLELKETVDEEEGEEAMSGIALL